MSEAPVVFEIEGLSIDVGPRGVHRRVIESVDLRVRRGEVVGIVGESGSGKTLTVLGSLGLLPDGVRVAAGSATLLGRELLGASRRALRDVRGREVGMIFQDPLTSLHPAIRIGDQIVEGLRVHDRRLSRAAARARSVELLERVQVPQAASRLDDYPHQWSGGMCQRAMIAMAIMHEPALIIADEPTTALDVTVQAQMLELLGNARDETGAALVLISHDLGVIAEMADQVAVMYAGRIVEDAVVDELFSGAEHPYTRALLASVPTLQDVPGTLVAIEGQPPDRTTNVGCSFEPRCDIGSGQEQCRCALPPLVGDPSHRTACHFPVEVSGS